MQDNKDSLNKNYIDVIYDVSSKPITDYPHKLTKHLKERFDIDDGLSILDVGCGRGDFLNGFINNGLNGYGVILQMLQKDNALKEKYFKLILKKMECLLIIIILMHPFQSL